MQRYFLIVGILIFIAIAFIVLIPKTFEFPNREFFQSSRRLKTNKYLWMFVTFGMFCVPKISNEGYRGCRYLKKLYDMRAVKKEAREFFYKRPKVNDINYFLFSKKELIKIGLEKEVINLEEQKTFAMIIIIGEIIVAVAVSSYVLSGNEFLEKWVGKNLNKIVMLYFIGVIGFFVEKILEFYYSLKKWKKIKNKWMRIRRRKI